MLITFLLTEVILDLISLDWIFATLADYMQSHSLQRYSGDGFQTQPLLSSDFLRLVTPSCLVLCHRPLAFSPSLFPVWSIIQCTVKMLHQMSLKNSSGILVIPTIPHFRVIHYLYLLLSTGTMSIAM